MALHMQNLLVEELKKTDLSRLLLLFILRRGINSVLVSN